MAGAGGGARAREVVGAFADAARVGGAEAAVEPGEGALGAERALGIATEAAEDVEHVVLAVVVRPRDVDRSGVVGAGVVVGRIEEGEA